MNLIAQYKQFTLASSVKAGDKLLVLNTQDAYLKPGDIVEVSCISTVQHCPTCKRYKRCYAGRVCLWLYRSPGIRAISCYTVLASLNGRRIVG